MPWDCCGEKLSDSTGVCPSCGTKKAAWTVRLAKTRVFTLARQTWIEIELRDHDGEPLKGEPYRIEGDGELYEGELDEEGFQRVTVKRSGEYTVTFPKIDERAWQDRRAHDEEGPGPIEFELLDADGEPLAGEAYRLELPDGSVREGTLDELGQGREEDLPGACTLVFPGFDERDFVKDRA